MLFRSGCGIGEVSGKTARMLTKLSINGNADIITVRDTWSLKELESLKITRPKMVLTADPAFCLPHASKQEVSQYFKNNSISEDGNYICFSIRNWRDFDNFEIYAKAAKYAYEKYNLTALFMPIEVPKDIEPSKKVISHMESPYHLLENPCDVPLIMGVFEKMRIVCAARLHALVFAASAGVPFVATSYDIKVKSFMENVDKSDLCQDLFSLDEAWLKNAIDEAMDLNITAQYKEIPNNLAALEHQNFMYAKELLEK